jgi:hypothetical protein
MTERGETPWSHVDTALVVVLLVGLIWWARLPFRPPEPAGVEALDTDFSADRALEHLRVIAAEPHLPGTPAHKEVRRYLVETLQSLGMETEVQSTTSLRNRNRGSRAVAVWNVLGRIQGTDPSGAILLMAHYDPVPRSSGASDAGTGVAAILEAVRALRHGSALKNDFVVLLSDAEELGLMGARAFVDRHRWATEISVVLNFEMRGHRGASMMFETGHENGWAVRQWAAADPHPVGNSVSLAVYRSMPNDTDFSPFRDRGIQGLNFGAIEGGNLYHLALDDLNHNSPETLQHQGIQALAMARHLGNIDLTETHAPDLAFTRVGLFGLIVHPPAWNWIGVALALTLALTALILGLRAGTFRAKGLAAGLGLAMASLLAAAFIGWVLFRGAQGFHPEHGRLAGSSFHREGWYFLVVMVLSLSLLLRFMGWGRRRFHLSELTWGAALLPLGVAVALTSLSPLAALNIVWPVLFGEMALLLFLLRVEGRAGDGWRRGQSTLGLGLLLMPVIFLMVPGIEMLWEAMSISFAPVLAAFGTFTAILLLPLLAPLQRPNRWWAPIFLEALALLSFGMGLSHASPGPDTPTPTSLFYVMDRDSGSAWWASVYRSDEPWVRSRIPDMVLRQQEGTLIPAGSFTAPAEAVAVPGPEMEVLQNATQGSRRILRLAITSSIGAELLEIRPAGGVEALLLGVGDWTAADTLPGTLPLEHWGDPGGPVEVELSVPADRSDLEFHLRETTFRPWRFLGSEAFVRPSHLTPSLGRSSDVAVFGTTIRIQVDPPLATI